MKFFDGQSFVTGDCIIWANKISLKRFSNLVICYYYRNIATIRVEYLFYCYRGGIDGTHNPFSREKITLKEYFIRFVWQKIH